MNKVMVAIEKPVEAVGLAALTAALAGHGAEVHVVHVQELDAGEELAEAGATVAQAVDLVRCRGLEVRGHVVVTDDGVAFRLVQHARQIGAELVVMGSHGLGRVGDLAGRSVSHAVLAELDLPVLILPDHARLPLRGFRRALAAVGSEGDAGPIMATIELLPQVEQVLVAHVPRRVAVHVGQGGGDTFAEIGETSTVVLAGAVKRLEAAGIPVAGHTAEREGRVGAAIARAATAWDADVVVLGTRRPGRWQALVAGSTLHDVLRLSDRPVLVAGR